MGQVSLPRLERINTSMTWESSIWNQTEQWAAPKIFIFYKPFINLTFNFNSTIFHHVWKKSNKSVVFWRSKQKRQVVYTVYRSNRGLRRVVMGRYVYNFNNELTTLVIYGQRDQQLILTKKIIKQLRFQTN